MGLQKSKVQNPIMCPLRGLVQHRPKNPPNLGRMGCLYQLLSPKGHMILFCTLLFWIPQLVLITFFNTICFAQNFSGKHLRRYSEVWVFQILCKKSLIWISNLINYFSNINIFKIINHVVQKSCIFLYKFCVFYWWFGPLQYLKITLGFSSINLPNIKQMEW